MKKKILIITFPLGGPRVWAENLAKHLRGRGFDATVAFGRKEYFKQLFQRYDIVHSTVAVPNPLCKKYILTIHGNYREEKHLGRFLYPLIIKRSDFVTTPSEFLKRVLGIKKALVIPNGIDLPEKTKNDYRLTNAAPTIGILTNFNFRKKADGLICLAKIVRRISPEIKLIVGGGGEFFEEYKKIVLDIHPNTEFLGQCKKEDLFKQVDIFAYYSLLDNQPIAILEAMAFGLPVMSNNVGAVKEILTGKLENYIAKTDEEYGNLLKELLNSQEIREENGQEAEKISQKFFWEKIVKRFMEIYSR